MKVLSALLLGAICSTAFAEQIVFQCTTDGGKQIQLVDNGKTMTYSYGPVGKPELVLIKPRKMLTTHQWQGVGRFETYTVNIPNGDTEYSIQQTTADHLDPKFEPEYELDVSIRNKNPVVIKCSGAHPIITNIEGVKLQESVD